MLCSRVQNLLSAYCDHELTGNESLQIRSHLSGCASCRKEQEALLQMKRLMGALSRAEPPQPFNPSHLEAAARQPWWWATLRRAARPYLMVVEDWQEAATHALRRNLYLLRTMPSRMALSGTTAIALATLALVHAPQHSDAVRAHVPESVSYDDRAVALLPLNEVVPPPADLLPDEFSAVQAAETIGAEQPIRLVSYEPGTSSPGFATSSYRGYAPYQSVYRPAHQVSFISNVSLGAFDTHEPVR